MPISISGLSSGLDTDAIIDKLVKIEREPIRRLERRKKEHNFKIKALNKLGKHLDELNKSAKDLYGFRASYSNTKVVSSNESVQIFKVCCIGLPIGLPGPFPLVGLIPVPGMDCAGHNYGPGIKHIGHQQIAGHR